MSDLRIPIVQKQSKLVAVVVPLSNRKELTSEEQISLKHLIHYLGKYDKYVVIPKSLQVDYQGFGIKRFDDKFFGSAEAHLRLLYSQTFYKTFIEYKYILIYHLDALVFSDQLMDWCKTDYDYIGAPWLESQRIPEQGFSVGGNGGFSLRKTEAFLRVVSSSRYKFSKFVSECGKKYLKLNSLYSKIWKFQKRCLQKTKVYRYTKQNVVKFKRNEDRFWSDNAKKYYPEFKIAPAETALRFAFECAPRYCFEKNNQTLPFGCHAWNTYDKDFWEPYLIK